LGERRRLTLGGLGHFPDANTQSYRTRLFLRRLSAWTARLAGLKSGEVRRRSRGLLRRRRTVALGDRLQHAVAVIRAEAGQKSQQHHQNDEIRLPQHSHAASRINRLYSIP